MSRHLITFSGKHGDIIWAAQSARALAATGVQVDMAFMPQYGAVRSLLAIQPYITAAYPIAGWLQYHDHFGAQPRIPPTIPGGYDAVHHLTYEEHPTDPLILYGLRKLGLPMPDPPVPFLFAEAEPVPNLVAYAFNGSHRQEKYALLGHLHNVNPRLRFEDVSGKPFDEAARRIQAARFFFGCRSANYVVAMGLGKRCLTIEPDGNRRRPVFGFPEATEHMPDPSPAFYHQFVDLTRQWTQ